MTAALHRYADACILPGFDGTTAPEWLLRRAAEGLGGVVLYHANMAGTEELRTLTSRLRAENPDFLVGLDEEGGDVTRLYLGEGSPWPGNLALGHVDDTDLTRRTAAEIGSRLAALGVNLDFAPVVDVNTAAGNPVIGTRSFGSAPDLVARHSDAFVRGLQSSGVAGCAKHFPGHGSTVSDSHHELPFVHESREEFDAAALPPFRAAIAAGVEAIMTAHIVVPAHDGVPATVSPRILTGLLRAQLGFDGVVVTDSMEMNAVHDRYGIAETGIRAIAAGADALCVGTRDGETRFELLRDALVAAVVSGRLPEERLAEAAGRMARMAARVRLPVASRTSLLSPGPDRSFSAIGLEAARRALSVRDVTPLTATPAVVEFTAEPTPAIGETAWGISALLQRLYPDLGSAPQPGKPLVAVVRDLHRHPDLLADLTALLAARPDTVVVEMGLPHWIPASPISYIATHGASHASARAVVELLTGRTLEP